MTRTGPRDVPRLGQVIDFAEADRYVGQRCAHCKGEYDSPEIVIRCTPKHAGRAGIVCAECWRSWVLTPAYRQRCGV